MENNYCRMNKTSASNSVPHDIHIKLHVELIGCLYESNIRELIISCSQLDDFNVIYYSPSNVLYHFQFKNMQL